MSNKVSTQQHVEDIFNQAGISAPAKKAAPKVEQNLLDDDPFSEVIAKPKTNIIASRKPNPRPARETTNCKDLTLNEYILKRFEEKIVFDRNLNVPQAVQVKGLSSVFSCTLDIPKGVVSLIDSRTGSITPYPFDKLFQKLFSGENANDSLVTFNALRASDYEVNFPASNYEPIVQTLEAIDTLAPEDFYSYEESDPFQATIDDLEPSLLVDTKSSTKAEPTVESVLAGASEGVTNAFETVAETKTKGRGRPKAKQVLEVEHQQITANDFNDEVITDVHNKSESTEQPIDDNVKLAIIIDELINIITRRVSQYTQTITNNKS